MSVVVVVLVIDSDNLIVNVFRIGISPRAGSRKFIVKWTAVAVARPK